MLGVMGIRRASLPAIVAVALRAALPTATLSEVAGGDGVASDHAPRQPAAGRSVRRHRVLGAERHLSRTDVSAAEHRESPTPRSDTPSTAHLRPWAHQIMAGSRSCSPPLPSCERGPFSDPLREVPWEPLLRRTIPRRSPRPTPGRHGRLRSRKARSRVPGCRVHGHGAKGRRLVAALRARNWPPAGVSIYAVSLRSGFEKAPYRLELRTTPTRTPITRCWACQRTSDWVLRGPFPDKTLIRDALAYSIGGDLGLRVPRFASSSCT